MVRLKWISNEVNCDVNFGVSSQESLQFLVIEINEQSRIVFALVFFVCKKQTLCVALKFLSPGLSC